MFRRFNLDPGISALLLAATTVLNAPIAAAADPLQNLASQKIALHAPAAGASRITFSGNPLILSAPPRDTEAQGHQIFDPLAAYLSQILGRQVIYKHPATWGGYQADMQADAYDIVFDGPHFNSWRIKHRNHNVLAKLPGEFVYTAVVRMENTRVSQLKQLTGRKICTHAPPNLGTLIMFSEFDNPVRQPVVIVKDGYEAIYKSLLHGECEAAMLPISYLSQYERDQPRTRTIFRTGVMPQQAFSAGARVTTAEQARISAALLSPAAAIPLSRFRKTYAAGRDLVTTQNTEYANLASYLRDEWGFN